jgi:DNA-binding GntR family transcriptional regulator
MPILTEGATPRASSWAVPLDNRVLRQRVLEHFQSALLEGLLNPGDRLVEAEIAAEMGISRGPVREAIRKLEEQGLVMTVPYKGSFVVKLTPADIFEICTLRAVLETFAVELVVQNARPAGLQQLDGIVQSLREAAEAGHSARLLDLDLGFHETLSSLCGHKRLCSLLADIYIQSRLYFRTAKPVFPYPYYSRYEEIAEAHQAILDAVRDKDATAAKRAIAEHIMTLCREVAAGSDELDTSAIPGLRIHDVSTDVVDVIASKSHLSKLETSGS